MDRMSKFLECHMPTTACNFRCKYCYVTQNKWWDAKKPDFSFVKHLKKAFSPDRFGGKCMINLCAAGETMLYPESVDVIRALLENGHYVMVVTNGTLVDRFKACANFPKELRGHLFFKMSFHYLELKRLNMLDTYFENARIAHEAGISFTIEITPDDSYIPYINEIKDVCREKIGAVCHVTVPRDETKKGFPLMTSLSRQEFVSVWESFDSELFRYKESIFEEKRKEFCYAGKWGLVINLGTGTYQQCYKGKKLGNIYDLEKPINYLAIGHHCREGHCFNGHAFQGFGLIPELEAPTFDKMRNRTMSNGEEWLTEEMKEFMSQKLSENNVSLERNEQLYADVKSCSAKWALRKILRRG